MRRSLFFVAALLGSAVAQPPSPLQLQLSQALVTLVSVEGQPREQLVPSPAGVRPGDRLAQQLTARNLSPSALKNAVLLLPVPRGTVYLGDATPTQANRWTTQFSADGGQTFGAAPLRKTVTVTENGVRVQKQITVPITEYTHVRWAGVTLAPKESLNFSFRVEVN